MEATQGNASADPTSVGETWASQFVASLRAQCARLRESLLAQDAQWEEAEGSLDRQIAQLLQQQRAKLRAAQEGGPAERQSAPPADGILSWEVEKARIMAILESDSSDGLEQRSERLQIEQLVRTTDQVIAEKEKQIGELKQQLAGQSRTNTGSTASDQNTIDAILEQDVLREERANLARSQQEWQDKLRQAEVELSVERAKIARERAELEERLRLASQSQGTKSAAPSQAEIPAHGRWLARLGLSDTKPEHDPRTP